MLGVCLVPVLVEAAGSQCLGSPRREPQHAPPPSERPQPHLPGAPLPAANNKHPGAVLTSEENETVFTPRLLKSCDYFCSDTLE